MDPSRGESVEATHASPALSPQVRPAPAMSIRKDEMHQQLSAPLAWIRQENLCPPGRF